MSELSYVEGGLDVLRSDRTMSRSPSSRSLKTPRITPRNVSCGGTVGRVAKMS